MEQVTETAERMVKVNNVRFFFVTIFTVIQLFSGWGCESKAPRDEKEQQGVKTSAQLERETFIANIDQHYQKVLALQEEKDLEGASAEADLFHKYGKLEYKDVGALFGKIKTAYFQEKLKELPVEKYEDNLALYEGLLALEPDNTRYSNKVNYYSSKLKEEKGHLEKAEVAVMEWKCYKAKYGDFVNIEGSVKNVSGKELKRILATVTLSDKGGKKVLSESAVIENQLLQPGQSSNFKIIADYLPAMSKAVLEFKPLLEENLKLYTRQKVAPVMNEHAE